LKHLFFKIFFNVYHANLFEQEVEKRKFLDRNWNIHARFIQFCHILFEFQGTNYDPGVFDGKDFNDYVRFQIWSLQSPVAFWSTMCRKISKFQKKCAGPGPINFFFEKYYLEEAKFRKYLSKKKIIEKSSVSEKCCTFFRKACF
jgi:hypothetical protein